MCFELYYRIEIQLECLFYMEIKQAQNEKIETPTVQYTSNLKMRPEGKVI